MSLTADVKAELVAVRDPRPTARVAELTSLLRFSGGLHSIANRVAVEAELDSDVLARRVARELVELYGVRPELAHVQSSAGRAGGHVAVRVIDGGETLARQTGLLDQRRRPVRGLPNKLVGFVMSNGQVPEDGVPVVSGNKPVGKVTSARFSPTMKKGFGIAWVPMELAQDGTQINIMVRGKLQPAEVTLEPFYDPEGERLRQ